MIAAMAGLLLALVGTAGAQQWYRGNTHTHTVICGHADSTPEYVAGWYLDRGYHFLILSEHNHFIDPDSVALPEKRRKDFILIPGEEDSGPKHIHSTAMNTRERVDWDFDSDHRHEIIQKQVDGAIGAGGQTILNHPNWQWALTTDDIYPVQRLHLFELHNGHPSVNNWGNADHASTEQMWDDLLTRGMRIYGVSSDDAHTFQTLTPHASNPGRGWVMVQADTLTADAITKAMQAGDFYASSGIFLRDVERGPTTYRVAVDVAATLHEVGKWEVLGHRVEPGAEAGEEGFHLDFIGPDAGILA
ncbi:MAG: CehA/McbA family metallohydrolase, partial [Gemmatimonadetes bacterium]|nr:CehA/McbA family metallohydrolase [Gemmatimonadota bacterium]